MGFANRHLGSMFVLAAGITLAGCAGDPVKPHRGASNPYPAQQHREAGPRDSARRALAIAQAMLGTPYRYGGASPRGFDCSGLVYYSFARTGIQVPRTTRDQYAQAMAVSPRQLRPGDLVFFKLTGAKSSHVGIYAGGGEFIHAPSSGKRVRRSRLDNPYWREHLVRGGRFL